jgi:hypothetical protein
MFSLCLSDVIVMFLPSFFLRRGLSSFFLSEIWNQRSWKECSGILDIRSSFCSSRPRWIFLVLSGTMSVDFSCKGRKYF